MDGYRWLYCVPQWTSLGSFLFNSLRHLVSQGTHLVACCY